MYVDNIICMYVIMYTYIYIYVRIYTYTYIFYEVALYHASYQKLGRCGMVSPISK
jgi:hypothetical protein